MVVQTQAAKRRCRSRERTDMSDIGRLLMSSGCREHFWRVSSLSKHQECSLCPEEGSSAAEWY